MIRHTPSPESQLTRLADGSLPYEDQAELARRVRASHELAAELAEQKRVVALLRAVDEPAPSSLRAQVQAMRTAAAPARRRRPRRLALAVGGVVGCSAAAAAAAVIVSSTGGGSLSPGVPEVAQVALASATLPAPAEDPARPKFLIQAVDGVTFPYWEASRGWRATGARMDTLNDRRIVTVFYASHAGTRVGYSIVAGPALPEHGATTAERVGVRFSVLTDGRLRVITWLRSGHTCVLTGRGVSAAALLRLATGGVPRPLPA